MDHNKLAPCNSRARLATRGTLRNCQGEGISFEQCPRDFAAFYATVICHNGLQICSTDQYQPAKPAPQLGANTDEVLADIVGLSAAEIGKLHDSGVVAGAASK